MSSNPQTTDRFKMNYQVWQEIKRYGFHRSEFQPETFAKLQLEDDWVLEGDAPTYDSKMARAVGLGKESCPLCGWTLGTRSRREVYAPHRGKVTGLLVDYAVNCTCVFDEKLWQAWSGPHGLVPSKYEFMFLGALQPSEACRLNLTVQAKVLDFVKQHPEDSYLLTGPSGYGKTTLLTGILSHAHLKATHARFANPSLPRSVFRIRLQTLLEELQAWDTRPPRKDDDEESKVKYPTVTSERIREIARYGIRPCLFLEEIDKAKMSEFRLNKLFDLVDAVYEVNGQLVMTSNMTVLDLESHYGDRYGSTMIRRVLDAGGDGHKGHNISLFPEHLDHLMQTLGYSSTKKPAASADTGKVKSVETPLPAPATTTPRKEKVYRSESRMLADEAKAPRSTATHLPPGKQQGAVRFGGTS